MMSFDAQYPRRICLSNTSIAKKKTLATLRIKLGLKNLRNMSIKQWSSIRFEDD
jgi:hypothetical protein